ncbi:MAG: hypothetical protein Q8N51_17340 [Gammaproteobacteria bacterium]|nr:hypothetical protein [Gammaproteobacteria bacterium]
MAPSKLASADPPPVPAVLDTSPPFAPLPPDSGEVAPDPIPVLKASRKWLVFILVLSYLGIANLWVLAVVLILTSPTRLLVVAMGLLYLAYGAVGLLFVEPLRRVCVAVRDLSSSEPQRCIYFFVLEHCTLYRRMGVLCCIALGGALLAVGGTVVYALYRH